MKVCSFTDALSHPGRRLTDHLLSLARAADRAVASWPAEGLPVDFRDTAVWVGLCHDAGKATVWFQERLAGRRHNGLTRHSELSACLLAAVLRRFEQARGRALPELLRAAAVAAVRRHHGPLGRVMRDAGDLALKARDARTQSPLVRQWQAIDWDGLGAWLNGLAPTLGLPPLPWGAKPQAVGQAFWPGWSRALRRAEKKLGPRDAVAAQLLFSLLVGCDKLDAALYGEPPEPGGRVPAGSVDAYRGLRFGTQAASPARSLRDEVANDVAVTLREHLATRLFSLTAPTGSGKTLSALEAALTLADAGPTAGAGTREDAGGAPAQARIVYCLPFTSIIDQNHAVLEDLLQSTGMKLHSGLLVKHHHLADASWRAEDDSELDPDLSQLLIESWQSHIVVTTFVQLIEALLGRKNRMLKKLMQLPGAVVLLDEVQTIARPYWELVRAALRAWAEVAGTRFLLLTATRPIILHDQDAVELCARKANHFSHLDRVRLFPVIQEPQPLEGFAEHMVSRVRSDPGRRRLVILNTIAAALQLFESLRDAGLGELPGLELVYLSTHLSPRERLARIRRLRDSQQDPCLVVSTQLVEAGVDLSVDEVIRDLAPLDAIIQAAGRCNRSGERGQGRVEVIKLCNDAGRLFASFVYHCIGLEVTEALLTEALRELAAQPREGLPERAFLRLGDRYFVEMWRRTACDEELFEAYGRLDFETLGRLHLIRDTGLRQDYFVLAEDDPEAAALWEEYCWLMDMQRDAAEGRAQPGSPALPELRTRLLTLRRAFAERLISVRCPARPEEPVLPLYPDGIPGYDQETGYCDDDRASLIL